MYGISYISYTNMFFTFLTEIITLILQPQKYDKRKKRKYVSHR